MSTDGGVGQVPRKAKINETIKVLATSANHGRVTGVSGNYGFNISLLNNWGRGVFHNLPSGDPISSRDARRFANVVRIAEEQHLIGKRSAFSCAEVNAVTILIGRGATLAQIKVHTPYGDNRNVIELCPACWTWMDLLDQYDGIQIWA